MGHLHGGKILRVDLSTREVRCEPVEPYAERFLGGKGIDLKILFDEVAPETKPYDPENLLLFGAGALVGTPFPGACRLDVMGKSPVTGVFGDSGMGGYLGAELKFAGYDSLVISGRAEKPVYLSIRDDRVEIRDASAIWGHDTYETPVLVRRDLGDPSARVVSIGAAGERLVVYASINSPTGNVAARTGLGAVMGSKKLKAVAVRGSGGISVARPQEFLDGCRKLLDLIRKSRFYEDLHQAGLTRIHDREMRGLYELLGNPGEGCEKICEGDFLKEHLYNRVGCFACPVACFDAYNIKGIGAGAGKCSPYGDLTWDLRNPDLMLFWKVFVECQRYGLDARSLSNVTAWLMKLHETGIISSKDTDGLPMNWGSPEAIQPLARKISYREGIGDLLADGLPVAAKKIGRGAERHLLTAKGSPSDMHIPPIKTMVLAAAVSPIGEDIQVQPFLEGVAARRYSRTGDRASFEQAIDKYMDRAEQEVGIRQAANPLVTEGKAALVRQDEQRTDIADLAGVCTWMTSFVGLPVNARIIAEFMSWGLGTTFTAEMLAEAGMRMHHLERAFNCRCGLTRQDDKVAQGYSHRLHPKGRLTPEISFTDADLEKMKDDYYRMMGWDLQTGNPTRSTLEKYGLADVADRLGL